MVGDISKPSSTQTRISRNKTSTERIGMNKTSRTKKLVAPKTSNARQILNKDKEQQAAMRNENFLDGKNPEDKGDSARHGIKKKSSISDLKKIRSSDTASPRKKQLAHFQINMRKSKK